MQRRAFLQASLISLSPLAAAACSRGGQGAQGPASPAPAAGSASAVQSSVEIPIGLQLYTLREPLKQDFEGTLGKVAAIGYSQLEFAGYYDRSPAQLNELLSLHGLQAPAAHIKLAQLREDLTKSVETAQAVGHKLVICPSVDKDKRETLDQFRRHIEVINRASEAFHRAGIAFGYHNHDYEFRPIEGQLPYDLIVEQTDPALVRLELDIYWLVRAGLDPVAMIERHGKRVVALHVKDMAVASEAFAAVGHGRIDYPPVLRAALRAGVEHYFVEQDRCEGPALEQVALSYEYLSGLAAVPS